MLQDPAVRRSFGIADARDVVTLQKKVEDLLQLVATLQEEVNVLKNAKPMSVKITQNASSPPNK
jgi:cell division septum initiation protein DivIVA